MPIHVSAARRGGLATAALAVAALAGGCAAPPDGMQASGRIAVAGTSSPSADLPSSLTGQRLDWSPCPAPSDKQGTTGEAPSRLPDGTRWECATLKAPVDYSKPEGKTLGIEMIKARKARGKRSDGDRIGSLLFNFGGPGDSGVATLPNAAQDYEKLRGRYDLVSFDPRGVGRSKGVNCLGAEELDRYFAADWTPDTRREESGLLARQRQFAEGCEKRAGDLLPHLTTENTARDMDLMRQVLGDDRLHYFGVSYGTELGGVYAHLFPKKVGRAFFDGIVDPTTTPERGALSQAKGFELALGNYLESCASQQDCPVGDTPQKGRKRIEELLTRLDSGPLPTQDGRKLTEAQAANGIAQALYSKELWGSLTEGLTQAIDDKDGSILLFLADLLNGRNQNGSYSTLQSSLTAVSCADEKQRYSRATIAKLLPDFTEASPIFGASSAWALSHCHDWPARGKSKTTDVDAKGSAPILLASTTGDPATPDAGARNMKRELGEGVGVLLTYEGEGHGAYGSTAGQGDGEDGGPGCVEKAVNGYLLDGRTPKDGTSCE
ncbi:alpha/beta hydrolase [Streptomyces sulphureus]|uniref:alpha/beta hydrolase n=1 Tax=Streptomyces sulphureus TaxID=47758 RepID=UPI000364EDA5|nr:alpha/beta hydrolase [Streptomyces sulphureus]